MPQAAGRADADRAGQAGRCSTSVPSRSRARERWLLRSTAPAPARRRWTGTTSRARAGRGHERLPLRDRLVEARHPAGRACASRRSLALPTPTTRPPRALPRLRRLHTNLPLAEALKDDVLLAHTVLRRAALPREHGGPVRVITPQLYAWKGAKWVCRLEFLKQDRKGFWELRGYSNTAHPWRNDRYSEARARRRTRHNARPASGAQGFRRPGCRGRCRRATRCRPACRRRRPAADGSGG